MLTYINHGRFVLKIILLIIFFSIVSFAKGLVPVTLQLSWGYQFQSAGYIIAKEKGFYQKKGLSVTLKEYHFGMDVGKEVLSGNADFGIGEDLLIQRKIENKDPFIFMLSLCQSSPVALETIKKDDIVDIKSLKEKNIFVDDISKGLTSLPVKAMLLTSGLNENDFRYLKRKFYKPIDLINGYGDSIVTHSVVAPLLLKNMGYEPLVFSPKDYGFETYGKILFTADYVFNKSPKTVDSFYEASIKGWRYAFSHIDETIDIIKKKYNTQNLDIEILRREAEKLKKLAYLSNNSFGDINSSKIKKIIERYNTLGLMKTKTTDYSSFIYEYPKKEKLRFVPEEKEYLATHPVAKVGMLSNFYPFDFVDKNHQHIGFSHDILDFISKQTGFKVEYVYFENLTDMINKLKSGDIDILGTVPRLTDPNLSYTPSFAKIQDYLFVNTKNQKKEFKSIGVIGWISKNLKDKKKLIRTLYHVSNIKVYTDLDEAIKNLQQKNIDALYAPKSAVLYKMQNNDASNIDFLYPKQGLPEEYLYMAFLSSNYVLNSIVSKALATMTLEESYALQTKWIPVVKVEKKKDWTLVIQIFIIMLVVFIMIIYKQMSISKINKQLRKQEKKLLKTQKVLLEQAQKDPLTKLYNRRYFSDISKDIISIAKRESKSLSVIMADIDNFKTINDRYGHAAGDKVLVEIAKRLHKISRKSDIVARYGGEEFIFLLPNTELQGAQLFAEKIRSTIESALFDIGDNLFIKVTISIGLTQLHVKEETSIESLFDKADKALYEAKRSGKNRVFIML